MILVTGAAGQLGCDLVAELVRRFGADQVVATDLRFNSRTVEAMNGATTVEMDITHRSNVASLFGRFGFDRVFHLAGILSARGEQVPDRCWTVNVEGLRIVLDMAREQRFRLFWPSSIAVFGPNTPKIDTPQTTVTDPSTMYGISKSAGEMLCDYYARRYGIDVRSVRYPGIISYTAPPGGGTTDYAVEMYFEAARHNRYTCFVGPETRLPMMYMPDAIKAALDLMEADAERITVRTSYNLTAFSFSAEEQAADIRRLVPDFEIAYEPDYRQAIADTWPAVIDDSVARRDWDWHPRFDLPAMTDDMMANVPGPTRF